MASAGSSPTSERTLAREILARLERPLRLLVYLLIALAIAELYQLASGLILRLINIGFVFMFAAVIAMLLTPAVDRLEHLPLLRGRREVAVLLLYGSVVLAIALVAALLASTVVADAANFGRQVPRLQDQAQRLLDSGQTTLRGMGINLGFRIPRGTSSLGGDLGPQSLTQVGGIVAPLVSLLLTIVVSIYLTIQGRQLVATARKLFPSQERVFDFTMLAVGAAVAAYVRAQLLMSLLMGLYTGVTLALIGVRYAAALGVVVFLLELIPLVGAPIGFALAIVIALTQSVQLALEATAISLVGHAIEAYVLGPRISGKVTRIHPLAAMAAILVGADLAGILGALLAIPIAVIGNIFLGSLWRHSQGEDALAVADTPGAVSVTDLPSLADELAVTPEEVAVVPADYPSPRS